MLGSHPICIGLAHEVLPPRREACEPYGHLIKVERMAPGTPVVRPLSWKSALPHLAVLGFVMGAGWFVGLKAFPAIGAGVYLVHALAVGLFVFPAHRAGMALLRRQSYAKAIPHLQASYELFTRHLWMDEWRFIALLSSSPISYREMALLNLAFCHAHLGKDEKAREFYLLAVREYPGSQMAEAGLRKIEAERSVAEAVGAAETGD